MREKRKSKHKFGGAEQVRKVCKAEQVRKNFVNLKMENKIFC